MSAWNVWTHLVIRTVASFLMSSSIGSLSCKKLRLFVRYQRPDILALDDARQVAGIVEIEHPQRQAVVPAHDNGGRIHHIQLVRENLVECQGRITNRGGVPDRIVRIDTVDLGCLEQYVGVDLDRAQR